LCTATPGTVYGNCPGFDSSLRFPVDPNSSTNSPLCPSNIHDPVVVFSPHPDDETLAMASVIRKAKDAQRTVIVELITNGDQSGTCDPTAKGTSGTCGQERCKEFMLAMQKLGVDGVTVNDLL
jgi:LmbE family N-acetylglucosaminyl deacetylase